MIFISLSYFVIIFLASSLSPTDKEGSILAHMQMSAHARSFHDTTRHLDVNGAPAVEGKNHQLLDSKYFSMYDANSAASRHLPPPMQYMGMTHLSPWQLAAH